MRLDLTAWLRSLSRRDRRTAEHLALGNRPSETARQVGLSRARLSQLCRDLQVSWDMYQRETPWSAFGPRTLTIGWQASVRGAGGEFQNAASLAAFIDSNHFK